LEKRPGGISIRFPALYSSAFNPSGGYHAF
jgi:hypothetical protein